MKGHEEKARVAGCNNYVTKPHSPIQLLRIIRGYLGERLVRVLGPVPGSALGTTC
jgi:CheY-like chemotaxis protein